jgi:hypothetical protein
MKVHFGRRGNGQYFTRLEHQKKDNKKLRKIPVDNPVNPALCFLKRALVARKKNYSRECAMILDGIMNQEEFGAEPALMLVDGMDNDPMPFFIFGDDDEEYEEDGDLYEEEEDEFEDEDEDEDEDDDYEDDDYEDEDEDEDDEEDNFEDEEDDYEDEDDDEVDE